MTNDGKDYEIFVATLQKAVLAAEEFTNLRNIVFNRNRKIVNSYGVKREFDIYWEYELGGFTYKTVIECKDYCSPITVDRIDAFLGKLHDIPGLKPVFATKVGYQSGAKKSAEHNNIELLVVREQNDSDWTDANGNPLIKMMIIELHYSPAARIHDFRPSVDAQWIKEHTDIDTSKPLTLSGMNYEIIIKDDRRGEEYSLQDLASRLVSGEEKPGRHEKTEGFEEAYIIHPKLGRLKLGSYTVDYTIEPPIKETTEIDLGKALVGVIEYLGKDEKKLIFNDDKIVTRKM